MDRDNTVGGMRQYFVYILASASRELYIGVTNDLGRRLGEHRSGIHPDGYAHGHGAVYLVHVESTNDVRDAIRREKQLKRWKRQRKLELIEKLNPEWRDLGDYLTSS
jgi:putative endonuclease